MYNYSKSKTHILLIFARHFVFRFLNLLLVTLDLCCCAGVFATCGEWGLVSSCSGWASHCSGFSCFRAWVLGLDLSGCGTVVQGLAVQHVESYQTRGQMCVPALAVGLLTTGPPGKSFNFFSPNFPFDFFFDTLAA